MNDLQRRLLVEIDGGLSRRQIAERSGVSEGTIRNILLGKRAHAESYVLLADYLKLPSDQVFRMAGVLPPREVDGKFTRDFLLSRLYDVLSRLPESAHTEEHRCTSPIPPP